MTGITQDDIQTVRIPFIGNPNNRDTVTSHDQRYLNVYFDVLTSVEGGKTYYMVKRPGGARFNNPSGTTGVGRGVYSWKGSLYSVVGTKIYKNTTDLGVTLSTSTGICGITEVRPAAATQYLCINDGAKLYCIATNGVVTTVTSNFPNPNTTDLLYFDTYLFTQDVNSIIYQCNTDDPTTWDNTKIITSQMFNGTGVGMAHQGNLILCFSNSHMQGFFDAGNASGSVLTNVEQVAQQIGCASQASIAHDENSVIWVCNTNTGGYGVYRLNGAANPVPISTAGIERILRQEGTSITSCVANWIRIAGHTFYVLNLTSQNRTLVYDVNLGIWLEWQLAGGTTGFPFVSFTQHNNALIGQHATDGFNYTFDEATTQDNGVNFNVLARFRRFDIDDDRRKYVKKADLLGDVQATTTNVSLQYSDDDYGTLSTARTMDMSLVRPTTGPMGNFRRRAWQISYTGANALRLGGLELRLRLGSN